jgi:hypothetical protein
MIYPFHFLYYIERVYAVRGYIESLGPEAEWDESGMFDGWTDTESDREAQDDLSSQEDY